MGQLSPDPLSDAQLGQLLSIPGCSDTRTRRALQQAQQALGNSSPNSSIAYLPGSSPIAYWQGGNTYAPIQQTQGDTIINEQANPRPMIQMTLTSDMVGGAATAGLTDYFGPTNTDLNVVDSYGLYPYALSGDSGLFQLAKDGQTLNPVVLNATAWYSGAIQADWDGTGTVGVKTGRVVGSDFFTPTCTGYATTPFDGGNKLTEDKIVFIIWDFYGPSGAGWYVIGAYACPSSS